MSSEGTYVLDDQAIFDRALARREREVGLVPMTIPEITLGDIAGLVSSLDDESKRHVLKLMGYKEPEPEREHEAEPAPAGVRLRNAYMRECRIEQDYDSYGSFGGPRGCGTIELSITVEYTPENGAALDKVMHGDHRMRDLMFVRSER